MKKKIVVKFLFGIVAFAVMIKLLTTVFVEPWVEKKIQAVFDGNNSDYMVEMDKVHILILASGIKLETITICSKQENGNDRDLYGEIAYIKFNGINLAKAIFKNDIDIRKVTISNSRIKGKIPFSREAKLPIDSPVNIRIGKIHFDKMELHIKNTSSAQSYSIKEGDLKVYDLQILKRNTLSPGIVEQFDFHSKELLLISPDSMYAYKANGIIYSTSANTLVINDFYIHPNYEGYDFTSRYKYQTDRIEAEFKDIYIHDFSAESYFKLGSFLGSYVEIGKMDMNIFRDKRKEFLHVNKPAFQDLIYNYPGKINIDSIGLMSGNVTYIDHAEEANHPGRISFSEIKAKVYRITDDTIYKTVNDSLELMAEALLMGKGKVTVLLKGKLFDSHNTFSLKGTLSSMEAKELNPTLERNAFIYATSGRIDGMNFSFTANNNKATGKMTLLYHGLDIAVKNKRTDDTTALKEKVISFFANKKMLDSNPLSGEEVRVEIIDYERDPERTFFHYCFKAILSGIKSSVDKSSKREKKL